jgi:hypothetical protein
MAKQLNRFPGDDALNTSVEQNYTPPEGVEVIPINKDNVTIEVVIKALTAFVYCAGSYPRTIEALADMGLGVRRDQLKSWSTGEYAREYQNIRENFVKQSEAEVVSEMRDIIRQAADAERLAIEKTIEGLSRPMSGKDASQAAFNLARVKKENVDKLQTLLGRPTQIIEDRSAESAIKRLIAKKIIRPMTESVEDDGA